jgi:transcriptional regulator with XRE-family HTH domain
MPAIKKLPDSATLNRLRKQGWTQKELAETYKVSPSAVWKALQRGGYTESVPTYRELIPWQVEDVHKTTAIMERFRSIVKQKHGGVLEEDEEIRLNRWLRDLEANGLVVAYHPDAPPNSASSKGGFYYTQRKPEDDWIVRRPAEEAQDPQDFPVEKLS